MLFCDGKSRNKWISPIQTISPPLSRYVCIRFPCLNHTFILMIFSVILQIQWKWNTNSSLAFCAQLIVVENNIATFYFFSSQWYLNLNWAGNWYFPLALNRLESLQVFFLSWKNSLWSEAQHAKELETRFSRLGLRIAAENDPLLIWIKAERNWSWRGRTSCKSPFHTYAN